MACGLPQGLVQGPIRFYNSPLGDIIRKHGLKFHIYTEDCQLYTSFNMSTNEAVSSLKRVINDIREWYTPNMLKLNDDETEMLVIGSKICTIPKLPDLNVGSTVITGEHVRRLGIIRNIRFTMASHISQTMQIVFLKIHQISYYPQFFTHSAAKTLTHAYIAWFTINYCY